MHAYTLGTLLNSGSVSFREDKVSFFLFSKLFERIFAGRKIECVIQYNNGHGIEKLEEQI